MGCRRPTGGVFKYVSSDTSHAEAFPVATPRGRSVSFPIRGTMVTYVTWDDWKEQNVLETRVFSYYYIIKVLFVTFDQFNVSLLNHKK